MAACHDQVVTYDAHMFSRNQPERQLRSAETSLVDGLFHKIGTLVLTDLRLVFAEKGLASVTVSQVGDGLGGAAGGAVLGLVGGLLGSAGGQLAGALASEQLDGDAVADQVPDLRVSRTTRKRKLVLQVPLPSVTAVSKVKKGLNRDILAIDAEGETFGFDRLATAWIPSLERALVDGGRQCRPTETGFAVFR